MAKRGNSEGSIFRRKDGRWASVITLGWETGKRKRKTFYGKTRHDVQVLLNEALNNQQKGVPIPPERQTVGTFLDYWLEESAKPSVRPRTFQSYSELVHFHEWHKSQIRDSGTRIARLLDKTIFQTSLT